ncbi:hypothetical protein DFA_11023 [Cavenderia fasciculata]|uniref:Uncharacterized protein n=1 Tax=Cavenderia fasciculata TaxID=261658 RepID=F4QEE9_CACFS|nr:uncharacterized protein DFA_11023 [Cavenderia fasciculata]EGG13262.1 hypothetical protein DFA_11023 [Cavenderia fasciculata]|eukprot:XP_004349961.1 hypothetical protein DFA_11023 [Cavenderia fasciculata]
MEEKRKLKRETKRKRENPSHIKAVSIDKISEYKQFIIASKEEKKLTKKENKLSKKLKSKKQQNKLYLQSLRCGSREINSKSNILENNNNNNNNNTNLVYNSARNYVLNK